MKRTFLTLTAIAALFLATPLAAQPSDGPQPYPMPPVIAAPRDVAYPGTIRLEVDATDTARRIFSVNQTLPVAQAGKMTLLYPQWIPGNHAPRGQIERL